MGKSKKETNIPLFLIFCLFFIALLLPLLCFYILRVYIKGRLVQPPSPNGYGAPRNGGQHSNLSFIISLT